jgi:hypothetical protein
MLEHITRFIASGKYIAAIGAGLVVFVGVLRTLLAMRWAWFRGKLGGYVLGFGSATLLYLGSAFQADVAISAELVIASLGAGWAASGGWEMARDILTGFRASKHKRAAKRAASATPAALLIIVATVASVSLTSCGIWGTKPGKAVIDCVSADRNQLDALAGELSPIVFGEKPDWSAIYERAKHAGKVIGGCVLSELVQQYLGGKKAVPTDESWKARNALEDFRKKEAGGATFHTKLGDL